MSEEIKKRDERGNLVYERYSNGDEKWIEYDKNNNEIHFIDSSGFEYWREYNERGSEIHCKNSKGNEYWYEYDERGNMIHYRDTEEAENWWRYEGDKKIRATEQEYKEIKLREQEQEFLNREPVSIFELMEL